MALSFGSVIFFMYLCSVKLNNLKNHIIMAKLTEKQIEDLKETHEKIRDILIKYGNTEYGDCIIDEISVSVGILPTTVYYNED